MIVVDASIAVKWLLTEADSDAALAFLERNADRIAAPDLLLLEVSRALVSAANARRIDRTRCEHAIAEWLAIAGAFDLHRLQPHIIEAASRIALDIGHPLADCLYLAVASDLGCDLVTADMKFAARVRASHPNVVTLDDPTA